MNQLCKVCNEPAAGFHFGAFTCEGCKSFFGRTYNNVGQVNDCKNGRQCIINKQNRTSCKACRLSKCLYVGMSKSGSRYGRRSNWFKIHCLLQEQASQLNNNPPIDNDTRPNPLSLTASNLSFLSHTSSPEDESKLDSPSLPSPDSIVSDTSTDVERRPIITSLMIESSKQNKQFENKFINNKRGSDLMVSRIQESSLLPSQTNNNSIEAINNHALLDRLRGLQSFQEGYSYLQASQIYSRLYPYNIYPSLATPFLNLSTLTTASSTTPISSPRSSFNTSPPTFFNENTEEIVPTRFIFNSTRKRAADSSLEDLSESRTTEQVRDVLTPPLNDVEQEQPIDLSVKRPKLEVPSSIPSLSPVSETPTLTSIT